MFRIRPRENTEKRKTSLNVIVLFDEVSSAQGNKLILFTHTVSGTLTILLLIYYRNLFVFFLFFIFHFYFLTNKNCQNFCDLSKSIQNIIVECPFEKYLCFVCVCIETRFVIAQE